MRNSPPKEPINLRDRKFQESLTRENPSGRATLVAGVATVSDSRVRTSTNIQLTSQVDGGTPGWLRVSARVSGTSFTITSSSLLDTSTVAWEMLGVIV